MSARLIKHSSDHAGLAADLASVQGGSGNGRTPEPSPLEAALRAAEVRADRLAAELDKIKAAMQTQVGEAREQARREAAAAFAADDKARSQMIAAGLQGARDDFRRALSAGAEDIAIKLARDGIEKLVTLRSDEPDWLARVIQSQLAKLEAQTVIALHLPQDALGMDAEETLRSQLPPGAQLISDPRLKPCTARIVLKIGEVFVDPRAGAAQLLSLLDEGL
jgi:hypothetical protein